MRSRAERKLPGRSVHAGRPFVPPEAYRSILEGGRDSGEESEQSQDPLASDPIEEVWESDAQVARRRSRPHGRKRQRTSDRCGSARADHDVRRGSRRRLGGPDRDDDGEKSASEDEDGGGGCLPARRVRFGRPRAETIAVRDRPVPGDDQLRAAIVDVPSEMVADLVRLGLSESVLGELDEAMSPSSQSCSSAAARNSASEWHDKGLLSRYLYACAGAGKSSHVQAVVERFAVGRDVLCIALAAAVEAGRRHVAWYLMSRCDSCVTPLALAAATTGGFMDLFDHLRESAKDVEEKEAMDAGLSGASKAGRIDIMGFCLARGATNRELALRCASRYSKADAVAFLLREGVVDFEASISIARVHDTSGEIVMLLESHRELCRQFARARHALRESLRRMGELSVRGRALYDPSAISDAQKAVCRTVSRAYSDSIAMVLPEQLHEGDDGRGDDEI